MYRRETADGLFRPIVYLGHKIGEEVGAVHNATSPRGTDLY